MKKLLTALVIVLSTFGYYGNAQESHIEDSFYTVQTGIIGIWANNETKIGNKLALRSEIGFDSGIWGGGNSNSGTGFAMIPVITVEPRFYYNLEKRKKENKNISRNSGNFLSLKTSYHPDWFVISNNNIRVVSDLTIIPTFGIRRNIGLSNFNYEAVFGMGYQHIFKQQNTTLSKGDIAYNLGFRVGYSF